MVRRHSGVINISDVWVSSSQCSYALMSAMEYLFPYTGKSAYIHTHPYLYKYLYKFLDYLNSWVVSE